MNSGDAAEQVVRMMLSGSEVAVKLTGSALKNGIAMLLALMKNHKKVYGKTNMVKLLKQTRDIRTFAMTPAQFRQFQAKARKFKLLFSAVQDKKNRSAMIDVILPVTELERANMVFEKMRFVPDNAERQTPTQQREEQTQKKEHRSGRDLRDTRDSSSTPSGKGEKQTTIDERPSLESRLKEFKAAKEQKRQNAPTRQKTRSRKKGRSK